MEGLVCAAENLHCCELLHTQLSALMPQKLLAPTAWLPANPTKYIINQCIYIFGYNFMWIDALEKLTGTMVWFLLFLVVGVSGEDSLSFDGNKAASNATISTKKFNKTHTHTQSWENNMGGLLLLSSWLLDWVVSFFCYRFALNIIIYSNSSERYVYTYI